MTRKQVVLVEWIILILAAAALVLGGIFLLTSRLSGRKNRQETEKISETAEKPESETQSEAETEAPDPVRNYLFSFAGDCTIGSLLEWQGSQSGDFQSVVGDNYAYPLSGVR